MWFRIQLKIQHFLFSLGLLHLVCPSVTKLTLCWCFSTLADCPWTMGCHVFSKSYHGITKLQELLVNVVGVLAWPMPGLGGECWSYLSENIRYPMVYQCFLRVQRHQQNENLKKWLVQQGYPAVQQVYPDLTWEGAGDTSKKSFIHQTSVVKPFSNHEWYIQCCQRFPSDAQTVDWLVWTNIHHPLWSANELQASSLLVRFPNPLATSKSKWVREPDLEPSVP